MRKFYLSLLVFVLTTTAFSQKNGSIKGTAYDTLAKQPVASATISVLDKKDSSLITFTMTDNSGRFELKGIQEGEYRLLISHVNYHSSNTFFSINQDKKEVDLGNIIMNDINKVLGEVVVTNEAPPVTMVGDTVQYNAGSFKTQPNASVEQLLKKLPGVKVDKDGTVRAQGEKVNRVLVDGKEFFGNDPKVATRNLPADAVDKVQVYDKQSDQAQLTGFDDGNYEKTINLKLKKDKKKGVFGKVNAGAGNKDRYEGKFNINSFKGARQMSAIGMGNNTNAEGFSFMDILNFSGALNQLRQGGGGGNLNFNVSSEDAAALGLGGNQNQGINTAWGGGLNYNNIIGNKLDWQSNIFYNRFNPKANSHILRQNLLPGGSNFYDQYSMSDNLNNTLRVNLNLLYQIDSFHSIRFIPSLSYQQSENESMSNFNTRAANGNLINDGYTDNNSGNKGYNARNEILFQKKFRHKGRTFSLRLQNSFNESNGDGSLTSIINYYANGVRYRGDTLNQQNETSGDLHGYSARAVYTEPIWKRSLLEFSAGRSSTSSTANKKTFDYNKATSKHDLENKMLSNDFENTYGYTNAGLRIRVVRRKFNYSLGVTWQQAELEGKVISGIKDSLIAKSFHNLLPTASFRYNFSGFKYLTLNYSTNTNQPSMSQLQPVPDISNPLYIREGNADLRQEFGHTLRANLNLVSPYKNKNFFMFFTGTVTQNKIVNNDSVDLQTGIRTTRPVNVNGVYTLNGNISYSIPVRFLKGTVELSNNIGYNKGKQFINKAANTIRTLTMGPELRVDMSPTDKLNLSLGTRYNFNNAKYSLQSSLDNDYVLKEYSGSVDWQLPKNLFFSTDFTYTINSQRAAGFNLEVPIWNASISKQFLKYNRGELKFSSFDLLNRNTGISRSANQNYVEDREINTLKRFFLFSFTYSLTKNAASAGNGPGGMRVIMR